MTNRQMYDEAVREIQDHLDKGQTVEILSGPCGSHVIKDKMSLRAYKHALWSWMNSEPSLDWNGMRAMSEMEKPSEYLNLKGS